MKKKGKIYVVGLGPGSKDWIIPESIKAIKESEIIIGYKLYIDLLEKQIKDIILNKILIRSNMRKELDRCHKAFELAEEGKIVSIVCSGDPGIYGMAGLILEIKNLNKSNIDTQIIPGISAVNGAASVLGAPLMHDFASISLSDWLTPLDKIEKRVHLAGEGDFVIAIYNPKSKARPNYINKVKNILLKYRRPDTPVGIVRNLKRDGETIIYTNLNDMLNYNIDMTTIIIIGNSQTVIENSSMITPRGYKI